MSKRRRPKLPQDPVNVSIHAISHEGRGIAQLEGKTIFVENALLGEEVSLRYTSRFSKFDEGIAETIIKPSSERCQPACEYYLRCGGCRLQHWDVTKQIAHKHQVLKELLDHQAHIQPETYLEPLTGPSLHYRHKARLGVRYVANKGDALVGFRELNGRYLTDMRDCSVLHHKISDRIDDLRQLITSLHAVKEIAQLEVAVGDERAAIIVRHLVALDEHDQEKIMAFARLHDLDFYLQPGNMESVHKIYPEDKFERLSMRLNDHNIEMLFHPCDFTQVNLEINQKMIKQALALLDLNQDDEVLDLFCGIGNFSLPIARYAKQVVGVEGGETMVKRARENTEHNQLTNTEFFVADLTQDISQATWAKRQYSKILLDPPRSGALELIQQIKRFNADKIVYISCNPATLARDTAALIEQGYRLIKAGVMDMFPHTTHVESMALFEKK